MSVEKPSLNTLNKNVCLPLNEKRKKKTILFQSQTHTKQDTVLHWEPSFVAQNVIL